MILQLENSNCFMFLLKDKITRWQYSILNKVKFKHKKKEEQKTRVYIFFFNKTKQKRMLIGPSECLNVDHSLHKNRRSHVVKYYGLVTSSLVNFLQLVYNLTMAPSSRHNRSHNIFANTERLIERKLDSIMNALSHSSNCRHNLCNHRYNCFIYAAIV